MNKIGAILIPIVIVTTGIIGKYITIDPLYFDENLIVILIAVIAAEVALFSKPRKENDFKVNV